MAALLSCNDDDATSHLNDESLNECYKIESKHITDLDGELTFDMFQKLDNNFAFAIGGPNNLVCIDNNLGTVWQSQPSFIQPSTVAINHTIQNDAGQILLVSSRNNEYSHVAKFSADGSLVWYTKFEEDDYYVQYNTIVQSSDGDGYWLAGYRRETSLSQRPIVTKINESGEFVWSQLLSLDGGGFRRMTKQEDKYLLVGTNNVLDPVLGHELFYYTMDQSGNFSSSISFGHESGWLMNTAETSDHGTVISSSIDLSETHDLSNTDIQLTKFDSQAGVEWTKNYGGELRELSGAVTESKSGGYFIIASTTSYGFGGFDILLVKTDPKGNVNWQNTYGTAQRDFYGSIVELANGDLIMVGATGDPAKLFIMRLDSDGKPK